MENRPSFAGLASKPIAPSSVPAGQMYLQKAGTGKRCAAYASGTVNTNTARITYLK